MPCFIRNIKLNRPFLIQCKMKKLPIRKKLFTRLGTVQNVDKSETLGKKNFGIIHVCHKHIGKLFTNNVILSEFCFLVTEIMIESDP